MNFDTTCTSVERRRFRNVQPELEPERVRARITMGTFLTNVQVHVGSADQEAIRAAIGQAIGTLLPDQGYRPCSAGEAPDREIVIAADSKAPWISIYDQASEDQGGGHAELARSLSRALSSPAVAILVHDSDVLEMKLFKDGRMLDEYCNAPGYFEGGAQEPTGEESAWQPVLRASARPLDLKKAWEENAEDAESALRQIAPILGMNEQLASVGYNSLGELSLPRERMTRLAFRLRKRPAHEARSEEPPRLAPGMPGIPPPEAAAAIFAQLGRALPPAQVFGAAPGEAFQFPILVHNQGGSGTGLEVTVAGPALEMGLVDVARIEVFATDTRGEQVPSPSTIAGSRVLHAELRSIPLKAGPRNLDTLLEGVTSLLQMVDRTSHVISIQVHCVARLQASKPLHLGISVTPLGSVERGCVQKVLIGTPKPHLS